MSFDELLTELQGKKTVQDDPDQVSLEQLFPDSFMEKHTRFPSFGEFMEAGSFPVKTHEDIRNLHRELLDRHVARQTDFTDWTAMLDRANREFAGMK
ncbi:hypothetical protein MJA45_04450 [Paenibacillus aurantius]|uniref:Uncharacterized protein n=1 Tax=Paenibacillus aurantius TaxID=2918900 RepID=A0AA96LFL0_9BACL|nr:hypothetical protein [Paenibacillus aurantius]WNQ12304.1 hypothetical protein MJA45_04450 [Paenibacillus aurantius]